MNTSAAQPDPLGSPTDWKRILFEVMDDIILVQDPQGKILEANAIASRRLGYAHAELLKLSSNDIDDPEFASGFFERLQFVRQFPNIRVEGKLRTRTGEGIHVDINASAVRLHGRLAVLSVARDVTQRLATERALRDSEALYHSLVASLPQNIVRKDLGGRLTFVNQRFAGSFGMTPEELVGKSDHDLFPPDLAAKYVHDDQEIISSGKIFETIEDHRLPDGTRIVVQVVKTPIRDAQGTIIGVQGIFWDVTAEQRAVLDLADSERRYRRLTEATLDGIVVIDRNQQVTLFNPAAERMFGYEAGEVLGQPLGMLVPARHQRAYRRGLHRLVRAGEGTAGRTLELDGRRKDGGEFPVEVALSLLSRGGPIDAAGQEPIEFLGALRDLTERNKIRTFLVQNEKLASIGMLAAGVAHEINNPLAFVANNLVVLDRDCRALLSVLDEYDAVRARLFVVPPSGGSRRDEEPPQGGTTNELVAFVGHVSNVPSGAGGEWHVENVPHELFGPLDALADSVDLPYVRGSLQRILERTRDGVDRVTRIVHSLRGLARTDAPRRQETHLPDLIAGSLEIVRSRLKKNQIVVEQDHDPAPRVLGVASQLSQVILNLLVNAVQAIEAQHSEAGRIAIRTRRRPHEMLLEIEDNGCGMAPETVAKIYEPFFTTKEVGEGTGLGLSITHNIVTAHGGRIEVDSRPGAGTLFRVFLPIHGVRSR